MNRRLLTILLSAFAIAALCSFVVFRIVSHHMSASPMSKSTSVVAAAADLKIGTILKSSDLTTVQLQGTLPQGVILKPEDAVGRGVISELYAGEPIMDNRLAAPGSGGGLAATIPNGMRAAAVRVDEVVGLAGFVTPGMRVDVLISGNPPGESKNVQGTLTKTLLQNIKVLSAGTDIQKDAEGKPHQVQVVNLLVNPEQAEKLSLAGNETRIQLVLRNPLDTVIAKPAETSVAQLFADNNTPPPPRHVSYGGKVARRAPEVYLVQVINGSKKSEAKFPAAEEKQ
ncbi:MAG TPA: Flp pilus assembly protein CpaB [Acidobacteriaceae bacterium]|jgi:pilus assembly protein CpaB|nr:Flp pilus assembly protein CpaB [Acidobacteriaceae bacterium]